MFFVVLLLYLCLKLLKISHDCRYSLDGADIPFSINATSGELFTIRALDRETVAFYRFLVVVTDRHSTQMLSSSATVSVTLEDVNDNSPSFLYGPYVANVPSGIPKGIWMQDLKEIVHPNNYILSSFTYPLVVPNLSTFGIKLAN